MVLAHSLIGVPLTFFVLKRLTKINEQNESIRFINLVYFVGILGAVFPDFDLILTFFIEEINHRKLISHSILPYFLIFISIYFFSSLLKKNKDKVKLLNLIFFVGIISHLLIDFLVGGISILAPVKTDIFGLPIYFNSLDSEFFYKYFTSWYIVYELILIFISIFYIFKLRKLWVVKTLPFFLLLVAFLMIFLSK